MTEQPSTAAPVPAVTPPQRRGFLAAATAIVSGAVITLTPLFAGGIFAFDPLCRKRDRYLGADAEGFLPVPRATLGDLPADGTPKRYVIKADLIDAWNLFKDRTLGTIYLRNVGGTVIAFNDTCPHLGCKVNYQSSTKSYYCPCHASAFTLDGKATNKIPPRDMDSLAVKTDPATGQIWVKYQDFKGGEHQKKAIG